MKFLKRRYLLIFVIIVAVFIVGFFVDKNFFRETPNLLKFDASKITNSNNTQNGRLVQQKKFSYNTYSGMHITFNYSGDIIIKQINPQLISLNKKSNTDKNSILYIYSAIVPANTDSFKTPFTISGSLKHSSIIKLHQFIANQETYGDGTNEVNLLVLRSKNNTIVIRIPKNSKPLENTITDVINSIQAPN